jgi:CcmD family protein
MYIVMAVVLVIWLGICVYLARIDRRIKKLEKDTEK